MEKKGNYLAYRITSKKSNTQRKKYPDAVVFCFIFLDRIFIFFKKFKLVITNYTSLRLCKEIKQKKKKFIDFI